MLGKVERPWRTLRDNAFAMLHNMYVPNSMWSCVISIVVYLRNRTFSHVVSVSGGVPLTLLTSQEPDASKFRVFGCTVFAKVPDKLRRKLGEKAFRGIMVGYRHNCIMFALRSGISHLQSNYTTHHHVGACSVIGERPMISPLPDSRFHDLWRVRHGK
jgi:predicted ATP-grasp superfamily ATP-dependent carboligase